MKFTLRAMKTYPSAQTLGFFDVELRVPWLEAKIKTRNDHRKPSNNKGSNVRKTSTKGTAMKSSTSKIELPP